MRSQQPSVSTVAGTVAVVRQECVISRYECNFCNAILTAADGVRKPIYAAGMAMRTQPPDFGTSSGMMRSLSVTAGRPVEP